MSQNNYKHRYHEAKNESERLATQIKKLTEELKQSEDIINKQWKSLKQSRQNVGFLLELISTRNMFSMGIGPERPKEAT